jgi:predicted alpha/beta-hydrolase family hydrolase
MEEGERVRGFDLSYMAVRQENKKIPFKLDMKHVLGRKAHGKMLDREAACGGTIVGGIATATSK